MTSSTTRERWIALLLPPFLVLSLYNFQVWGLRDRSQQAARALEAARKTGVVPAQFMAEQQKLATVNQETAEIEKQLAEWEARWQKLRSERSTDSTLRIETIEGLTELLHNHGLRLIEESPAEPGNAAQLPPALERVAKLLSQAPAGQSQAAQPAAKTQLWRVRFAGRYEDVVRALDQLEEQQPLAIPIHLQMGEAKLTSEVRSWTLFIWI